MGSEFDPDKFTRPFQLTKTIHHTPYPAISAANPVNAKTGQIIVITGGGTGIGAAAAGVWCRAGAAGVVIAGRRLEKLEQVAKELRSKYPETKVLAVRADVTIQCDMVGLFRLVVEVWGRPADVVLANAGVMEKHNLIGDQNAEDWWNSMTINMKGPFLTVQSFVRSQPDPKDPTGTIVFVSSSLAGRIFPGFSSYSIGKLAEQRFGEYVDAEYPNLRVCTVLPGLVMTDMIQEFVKPWGIDHVEMVGSLALYLSQARADYLRGCLVSVNWDVEEMEADQKRLLSDKMLKISWLPALPIGGGTGLL